MSRRQFRATVEERPTSAWLLVSVASALLWITGQLQGWVIPVEAAAIGISLWRRTRPFRWQASPIALNVGMFGIAGTTISLALDGSPSTVSLAHFAALTQGLQLLDSRPRKSEFLLVTLALFQVILAANLTDSLLFPPLLALFVVSSVWTLMVHTLRSEAIEAGDEGGASRAITPALQRMTAVASILSILVAMVLFVFLPRMRTNMFQSGLGATNAVAGFSDQVELGTIGRIRSDRTVVLRIKTVEGEAPEPGEAYWRGLAFDSFDGRRWEITPPSRFMRPGSVKFGIPIDGGSEHANLVQVVVREPVGSGVIFGSGFARHVSGALLQLESDVNGGLYDSLQANQRIRYTIETEARSFTDDELARDTTELPDRRGERYLALPAFKAGVGALAATIVEGLDSDAERARAIERHLRAEGSYTDTPPPLGREGETSPIEDFLTGDLAGHCEYFASGMVVLARSVGLPARLVNGFAGGRVNPLGGFVEVSRAEAHAWVEIHYRDAGWVRYDPTPPNLRLRAGGDLSIFEHLAALGSTIELWWFQRVVDFDSSDQIRALKSAFAAWKKLDSAEDATEETSPKSRWYVEDWLRGKSLVGGIIALSLLVALGALRGRRSNRSAIPEAYATALRLLSRRGLKRTPQQTARSFSRDVEASTSPSASQAFQALTDAYLAERFGSRPPPAALSEELERLSRELRAVSAASQVPR